MKVNVHGKIFISGEYGVVHRTHAILAPTEHTMNFEIKNAEKTAIFSEKFNDTFYPNLDSPMPKALKNAYLVAMEYIKSQQIETKHFNLKIQSSLDLHDKKLGLGSSAALSIGTLKSVLLFHEINLSPFNLYKLSVISNKKEMDFNSYGDVALAAFGQWILYRKFDFAWLKKHLNLPINELIEKPWEGLKIEPFIPKNNPFMIINTLKPAKSKLLVKNFNHTVDEQAKRIFFRETNDLTLNIYAGLKNGTLEEKTFLKSATLYANINNTYKLKLISNTMIDIYNLLKPYVNGFKISGAGGGDNIIIYAPALLQNKITHRLTIHNYPIITLKE